MNDQPTEQRRLDIAALRVVAKAVYSPGPWSAQDVAQWIETGPSYEINYVPADGICAGERVALANYLEEADAVYIATLDPPTVLALLDRLERAEAELEQLQAVTR